MRNLLLLQTVIVSDRIGMVKRRCDILRAIILMQPIGLRALAVQTGVGERRVRRDIDFLIKQRLVTRNRSGIYATPEGELLLSELEQYLKMLTELRDDRKHLQLAEIEHGSPKIKKNTDLNSHSYVINRI